MRLPISNGGILLLAILVVMLAIVGGVTAQAAFLWVLLALPFLLGLMYAMLPDRASWRRRQGLCTSCGYDLRGGQTRCPECGSAK